MIKYPQKDHQNEYTQYIFTYAPMMEDFPNSLSIHAGRIMISEEPLSNYTTPKPMPKGFPICQFDMYLGRRYWP